MIILSKLFRDIYPTDSGIIFVWWETCELFSQEITQTGQIPTGNSEPVHNFPEKLILTFFFPNILNCDRSYCTSVVLTGCQSLVALVEAISTAGGTRSDSYRVEMPNRSGNFRNFQISEKKKGSPEVDQNLQVSFWKLPEHSIWFWTKISKHFGRMVHAHSKGCQSTVDCTCV